MSDEANKAPWAFVCHKDGRFGGVTRADRSKKETAEFISSFVNDGYAITTVFSREEYLALLKTLS